MLSFNSFDFFLNLFSLMIVLVPLYWALPWETGRKLLLSVAGLYLLTTIAPRLALFYLGFWLLVWVLQNLVERSAERREGLVVLWFSILVLLAFLLVWRFAETWFIVNFNLDLNGALGAVSTSFYEMDLASRIITPIGLSFACFRAIDLLMKVNLGISERAPVLDVYYFGLFPSVQVIGPVAEFTEINVSTRRWPDAEDLRSGFGQCLLGLFRIFVLAYPIRQSANLVSLWETNSTTRLWLELVLYGWFFYLNFAGFSDLAIGSSRLFGTKLKPNFRSPYKKTNPQDFWNSWHMSLTGFFQRYVFLPLGGFRPERQFFALFATIMAVALWHDISWQLVIFGTYHGVALIGHRILSEDRPPVDGKVLRVAKSLMLFFFFIPSIPLLSLEMGEVVGFYSHLIGL